METTSPLPAPSSRWALFLDVDGTLIDIAEAPDKVVTDRRLAEILSDLAGMLGGAVALVVLRCLSIEQAYRAIDWRVILLIGGFMPLGTALVDTGLTDLLTTALGRWLSGAGPLLMVAVVFLIAAALAQLVGGQVAALIIAPIAVSLALHLGIDARAAGLTVAVACSAAFLTPIAHPVNLLTMGPGGYVSSDFARVGWGLLVTCFVVSLAAVSLVFHLSV